MRIEDETSERAALDVLALVSDGNLPLSGLVWLERGREHAVVVVHRAVEIAPGRRNGLNFQIAISGAIRIDLILDKILVKTLKRLKSTNVHAPKLRQLIR